MAYISSKEKTLTAKLNEALGKPKDAPLTDATIKAGLNSKDPSVVKIAQALDLLWDKTE